MKLYGETLSRREVASRAGDMSQFAGVRLMTLGDGLERGIRMLEFRSGTGLRFTVLVDRCMDVADCDYRGMAVGWNSPSGFRHPALHEYEGEGGLGFLRSFSGLMITCGMDHILFMNDVDAGNYNYGPRPTASHSIHGRAGTIPARLTGYGERWDGDRCFLWAEGVVRQAAVFGEYLEMTRRIEIEVGTNDIQLHDVVRNAGFYETPHMYCYHINVGHPVLAEGSRYLAPIHDVVWAAHEQTYRDQGVGYRTFPGPQDGFHEQVWQHDMTPDTDGSVSVALVNDALSLGFEVITQKDQFPAMYEWQNLQAGQYALGIEPSTNHVLGNQAARDRGEMIWLGHGEERHYDSTFRILTSSDEIKEAEARVAHQSQPDEDFPALSGNFPKIEGRRAMRSPMKKDN
ncbi:aldose 1-epimerase family protein [Shimia biformata]|uniref:aldose 1-epimerase family protein n=1 Tax=Shimia biformata TaxID=1294299 RepID=UPI00194F20EF|nr:aldose 1-epimerase family protein [Shimia biformata]